MKSNSRNKADIDGIIKRFSSRYSLQGRRKDGLDALDARARISDDERKRTKSKARRKFLALSARVRVLA